MNYPKGLARQRTKKKCPDRGTRVRGQSLRGPGSEGVVGQGTGVAGCGHVTGDFPSGSQVENFGLENSPFEDTKQEGDLI